VDAVSGGESKQGKGQHQAPVDSENAVKRLVDVQATPLLGPSSVRVTFWRRDSRDVRNEIGGQLAPFPSHASQKPQAALPERGAFAT
jgi:hypothetical protein